MVFNIANFLYASSEQKTILSSIFYQDLSGAGKFGSFLQNLLSKYSDRQLRRRFYQREGSQDEFVVFLQPFCDSLSIELGSLPEAFPRGFPIYWKKHQTIINYGFFRKFSNDDRMVPIEDQTFQEVKEATITLKLSGCLGQTVVLPDGSWAFFSKNLADKESVYVQNIRKIFESKITTALQQKLMKDNLHLCMEVIGDFDMTHGYQPLSNRAWITAIGKGNQYNLEGDLDENQDNFTRCVEFMDQRQVIAFCHQYHLDCCDIWTSQNPETIAAFGKRLSETRDMLDYPKFEALISEFGFQVLQGTASHHEISRVLEGFVIFMDQEILKYKLPEYTLSTMLIRSSFSKIAKLNGTWNQYLSLEFNSMMESYLKRWCVTEQGRKHWRSVIQKIYLDLADFGSVEKIPGNPMVGAHIRVRDLVCEQGLYNAGSDKEYHQRVFGVSFQNHLIVPYKFWEKVLNQTPNLLYSRKTKEWKNKLPLVMDDSLGKIISLGQYKFKCPSDAKIVLTQDWVNLLEGKNAEDNSCLSEQAAHFMIQEDKKMKGMLCSYLGRLGLDSQNLSSNKKVLIWEEDVNEQEILTQIITNQDREEKKPLDLESNMMDKFEGLKNHILDVLEKNGNQKPVLCCFPGPQAIGKSFLNHQIKGRFGDRVTIASADAFFKGRFNPRLLFKAHQHCQSEALEALSGRKDSIVLVDNTCAEMWQMQIYAKMASACGATFVVLPIMPELWLTCQNFNYELLDILDKRCRNRYNQDPVNQFQIGREIIEMTINKSRTDFQKNGNSNLTQWCDQTRITLANSPYKPRFGVSNNGCVMISSPAFNKEAEFRLKSLDSRLGSNNWTKVGRLRADIRDNFCKHITLLNYHTMKSLGKSKVSALIREAKKLDPKQAIPLGIGMKNGWNTKNKVESMSYYVVYRWDQLQSLLKKFGVPSIHPHVTLAFEKGGDVFLEMDQKTPIKKNKESIFLN